MSDSEVDLHVSDLRASSLRNASDSGRIAQRIACAVGCVAIVVVALLQPSNTQAAVDQDWPPFVLVVGLLLVGLVASREGMFETTGKALARIPGGGAVFFIGAGLLVTVVTAFLNLDTSVAFLTPVLIFAARRRVSSEMGLLFACLFLSNAASMILPGANLTNLIVLGHLHLAGSAFVKTMALPSVAAIGLTGATVGIVERKSLRRASGDATTSNKGHVGFGVFGTIAVAIVVVSIKNSALPVFIIGFVCVLLHQLKTREPFAIVREHVGIDLIVGLFGIAVALGTLGRVWSGPATLLHNSDAWLTAVIATLASVAVNNLPAASLFAAKNPTHPYALLVGLDVGPNLFVTGSLSWILWWRAAKAAGVTPNVKRAVIIGVISVPLSIAAAVACLQLTGNA